MDPSAIAALVVQMLNAGIQVYNELHAANASSVPPLATVLATADVDWSAVAAQAAAQLNSPTGS